MAILLRWCFVLALWFAIHGFCVRALAMEAQVCTITEQDDAMDADPKDWRTFYTLFKRLSHCDDGAMGENFSDIVVTMLAKDWKSLTQLKNLAMRDKAFERVVLKHIDATTGDAELRQVIENSERRCPSNTKRLCKLIHTAAKAAYADL